MDSFSTPVGGKNWQEAYTEYQLYLQENPEIEVEERIWQVGKDFVVIHIVYKKPLNRVT